MKRLYRDYPYIRISWLSCSQQHEQRVQTACWRWCGALQAFKGLKTLIFSTLLSELDGDADNVYLNAIDYDSGNKCDTLQHVCTAVNDCYELHHLGLACSTPQSKKPFW